MARKLKPDNVVMYLTDEEQKQVWNEVKQSFGSGYSQSGILYKLVQERYWQVKDGGTKRDLAVETLELVKAMTDKLNAFMMALAARGNTIE